jgi:electron transfer flavoprotein beta subunit
MKILVPIKRVPDYAVKVKVAADGSRIETDGIKWIANPFDEIAVEEALRLKEAGVATEVIVVTIGPEAAEQQLRYGMAMGADSGIHVVFNDELDSDLASRVLAAVATRAEYPLIILGKQSIDSDANQTGQLLAMRLDRSIATFASRLLVEGGAAVVTREVDGGLETVRIPLPAVVTTDLRLNEPRYASLPGIMKAKKKPVEQLTLEQLSVAPTTAVRIRRLSLPPKRGAGRKVADVAELVRVLQEEAKVL